MKILYGVVGEGMGHAMRSRVVLEHLTEQGHQVAIMASSRAADFLGKRFEGVHRIHGLFIIYEENRVRRGRTLWSNVRAGVAAVPQQIAAYFDLVEKFEPEVVISDFESWTYLYAKLHRLPIISVDNMQIINRATHPDEVLAADRANFELTRAFVKGKLPGCNHYVIATFFYPPLRKEDTTLVPPILRPEILAARPEPGDHLLVYQTAEGHESLVKSLSAANVPCRVYGLYRDLKQDRVEGNLTFRPFDERQFILDVATSRAVVAGGGFTLMGECVYLHKPMLAVPVGRQFEQVLNARYLEQLGYGRAADVLDTASLLAFLEAVPQCERRLADYSQNGNQVLFDTVDHLLDRAASGLL